MKHYRNLKVGEIIQKGDEVHLVYQDGVGKEKEVKIDWHPVNILMIGKPRGEYDFIRRPIPNSIQFIKENL